MGQRTDHVVTQVWLNLEDRPAEIVNIRYEFRPQLVTLKHSRRGREASQRRPTDNVASVPAGFEPGFSPELPRR